MWRGKGGSPGGRPVGFRGGRSLGARPQMLGASLCYFPLEPQLYVLTTAVPPEEVQEEQADDQDLSGEPHTDVPTPPEREALNYECQQAQYREEASSQIE